MGVRNIIFKAKRKDDGEWVEGSLVVLADDDYRIVTESDSRWAYKQGCSFDGCMTNIDPSTICQYTGLTDKNGNKIFENDIVSSGNLVVTWDEKFASFCLSKKEWAFKHFFGEAVDGKDVRVIGNIFDNQPHSITEAWKQQTMSRFERME